MNCKGPWTSKSQAYLCYTRSMMGTYAIWSLACLAFFYASFWPIYGHVKYVLGCNLCLTVSASVTVDASSLVHLICRFCDCKCLSGWFLVAKNLLFHCVLFFFNCACTDSYSCNFICLLIRVKLQNLFVFFCCFPVLS